MPHDPVPVEEVRAWLKRAAEDLRAGELELTVTPPLTRDAVFHAQQAAGKALKAFLSRHDVPFRKPHSIAEIGGACPTACGPDELHCVPRARVLPRRPRAP